MKEAEILARARRGDREAFARIIDSMEAKLYRVAFLLTGNREKARDLLQEVFLQFYLSLPRFYGRCSCYTFAYRILINLNHKRARKERATRPELLVRLLARPPKDISPGRALQQKEAQQRVRAAVTSLPVPYQEVVVMYYLEESSCAEIGRQLHLKEGTVKSRLSRGRSLLRSILEESSA